MPVALYFFRGQIGAHSQNHYQHRYTKGSLEMARAKRWKKHRMGNHDRAAWKGAAAGAIGGLVASFAMNQFSSAVGKFAESRQQEAVARESQLGGEHNYPSQSSAQESTEDATIKAARRLARLGGRQLSEREKRVAGPALHYLFGTAMGAAYGALADKVPAVRAARGLPFGAALWLGADEIAVPAMKLASGPLAYSAGSHFKALAAHAVYGTTTELVRRGVRAII